MLSVMQTIIGTGSVLLVLCAVVGAVIYSMVRDKKKGKSSCGGNCGCCPMGAKCHSASGKSAADVKK